jgi:hypothetical protein
MKEKQLPGGLDEWLKTATVVIGGMNWLAANRDMQAQRASQRKPKRSPFAETTRIPDGSSSCRFSSSRPAVLAALRG